MQRTVRVLGSCLLAVAMVPGSAACAADVGASSASVHSALTLPDVIARNTKARGGAAALDRAHAVAFEVEIREGGMVLRGNYAANDKGLVRVDVYADGKLAASEGIDKDGVWILGKDGPRPSVATGAANALTHGAENHLFGWHRFAERGHKLKLMPSEKIDGTIYQVVEIKYSTGHTSYFYLDPVSWQAVRRRDERAYHPDVSLDKKRVESRFYDFVSLDGIVASHRSEDIDLGTGKVLAGSRVIARRINPQLSPDHFDRNRRETAMK